MRTSKTFPRSAYAKWKNPPPVDPEAGIEALRRLYERVKNQRLTKTLERRNDAFMLALLKDCGDTPSS